MFLSRKAGLKYVVRGDPASFDFDQTTLTQDGAWHTLDLSAIIPVSAQLVHLRLAAAHTTVSKEFYVMKTGFVNGICLTRIVTQVSGIVIEQQATVPCEGQHIDYWLSSGSFVALRLCVLGWYV